MDVEVFTSSTCCRSASVKKFFNEEGVEFIERNVSIDPEARRELVDKGFVGVPVIVIDDQEIIGFDKTRIEEALSLYTV